MIDQALADNKEIKVFATHWCEVFERSSLKEYEIENQMPEQMFSLGFQMDCGKAFSEAIKDNSAFEDNEVLRKTIDNIYDISALTSGLFSKYRYITHWSETDLLASNNREWFVITLRQLAKVTSEPTLSNQ